MRARYILPLLGVLAIAAGAIAYAANSTTDPLRDRWMVIGTRNYIEGVPNENELQSIACLYRRFLEAEGVAQTRRMIKLEEAKLIAGGPAVPELAAMRVQVRALLEPCAAEVFGL